MIRNYKDLAHFRSQLNLAMDALVSLHERVYAKNPRNYAVFAEAPIDMILELRAEIDAFLHIAPSPPEMAASGDSGTTSGESVARDAHAEVVAVAGTPEATS